MATVKGYIKIFVKFEVSEEALASPEIMHDVVQELDYDITPNTEGVELIDSEITDYVLDEED